MTGKSVKVTSFKQKKSTNKEITLQQRQQQPRRLQLRLPIPPSISTRGHHQLLTLLIHAFHKRPTQTVGVEEAATTVALRGVVVMVVEVVVVTVVVVAEVVFVVEVVVGAGV